MQLVSVDDVVSRLDPQPDPSTYPRIELLVEDAEELVGDAFAERGRSLEAYVSVPWQERRAARVIREMVSAAILVGPNAGVRSVSSATGQESDSITYADVDAVSFGGVRLSDAMLVLLGLWGYGLARGSFPGPRRWPEVIPRG